MDSLLTQMTCMHLLKENQIWEHQSGCLAFLLKAIYQRCSSI
nr:MAG TPA: hypothetical protein [Caudoviricetes sp.]